MKTLNIAVVAAGLIIAGSAIASQDENARYLNLCKEYLKVLNETGFKAANPEFVQSCTSLVEDDSTNASLKAKALAIISKSTSLAFTASNYIQEPKPTYTVAVSSLDIEKVRCSHSVTSDNSHSYCVVPVLPSEGCKLELGAIEFDFDPQGNVTFSVEPSGGCIHF